MTQKLINKLSHPLIQSIKIMFTVLIVKECSLHVYLIFKFNNKSNC